MITLERLDPELVLLTAQSRREYKRSVVLGWVLFVAASIAFFVLSIKNGYHYFSGQVILGFIFFYLISLLLWLRKSFSERNEKVLFFDWAVRWWGVIAVLSIAVFLTAAKNFDSSISGVEVRYLMNRFLLSAGYPLVYFQIATFFVSKFAIHADGIYHRKLFYRWDRIMKVRWAGENRDGLSLTVKIGEDKWGEDLGTPWKIPAEKISEIQRLLASRNIPQEEVVPSAAVVPKMA